MESSAFTVFLSRYYRFPKLFPHLAASLKGMASSNKCLKSGSRLKEYFTISRAISSESYKKCFMVSAFQLYRRKNICSRLLCASLKRRAALSYPHKYAFAQQMQRRPLDI